MKGRFMKVFHEVKVHEVKVHECKVYEGRLMRVGS